MRERALRACLLLSCLAAMGCGPLIGQMMKSSVGVKDFQVREGDLRDFGASTSVLVFAPFAKGEKGYYLCRGEDEALLAEGFQREGMFSATSYLERDGDRAAALLAELRAKTPEEVRDRLGLKQAPDAILSGVILERDETVAPTVGILQELRLRLDLYGLQTKKKTSVEIAVKAIHRDAIPLIVTELKRRIAAARP